MRERDPLRSSRSPQTWTNTRRFLKISITQIYTFVNAAVKALNLNQAKEGAETAIAFFISTVSALLERPTDPTTVVIGEMSVKGLLRKVSSLPERLELALSSGAKKVLIPSENKRDLADVPDEVLNKLQPVFYTDPINAAIRAMGLE